MAVGLVVFFVRRLRARPATWAGRVARSAERAGRRAGRPRRPAETLADYADRLDELGGREDPAWSRLAASVEASAYGGLDPPREAQRALALEAKRARVPRRAPVGSADASETTARAALKAHESHQVSAGRADRRCGPFRKGRSA